MMRMSVSNADYSVISLDKLVFSIGNRWIVELVGVMPEVMVELISGENEFIIFSSIMTVTAHNGRNAF